MYHKAYGIIETLAPLHVGATAGEETGNSNLIFRDQFTQTGVIPGSSIRGRFRADMRSQNSEFANEWYGYPAKEGEENSTTEALVKFEYASLVWLPVFCPGQPVVWVTSPRLLKRYQKIVPGSPTDLPTPYSACPELKNKYQQLFFNLGFLTLKGSYNFDNWTANIPRNADLEKDKLLVVSDTDISMIHDMALYRQSRVKLEDDKKKVDEEKGAFFNVEALPEGSILVFPVALKKTGWTKTTNWQPFGTVTPQKNYAKELYFGGLESIGFGRCKVTLAGHDFSKNLSQTETESK
ncbi:MAG: RAMP superfamily CRISPR-associated protein [Phormidium sp.]